VEHSVTASARDRIVDIHPAQWNFALFDLWQARVSPKLQGRWWRACRALRNCYILRTIQRSSRGQLTDVLVEQDRRRR